MPCVPALHALAGSTERITRFEMEGKMSKWKVTFECRQIGALGVFELRDTQVEASTREAAYTAAMKKFNDAGYETRFSREASPSEGHCDATCTAANHTSDCAKRRAEEWDLCRSCGAPMLIDDTQNLIYCSACGEVQS